MIRKILLVLSLFGCVVKCAGATNETYAVVRIPSHGCSATVINTGNGYSWILGCGHAYYGSDYYKPMVFDICRSSKDQTKKVGNQLMYVDYNMDLSLVYLAEGPLDYVARVGPIDHKISGHKILSCGFDEMKFPMHQDAATILEDNTGTWYTREKPWHGRSGGGLIDVTSGCLIGVCQGYECPYESRRTRGMYVDLKTIQTFIERYANAQTKKEKQPQQFEQIWRPQQQQYRFQPSCPGGS